jgi:hypothetical protein
MSGINGGGVISSTPIAGATRVTNIFNVAFTADLGTVITLNGLVATQAITGLLTTDQVFVQSLSALPTGVSIGNARVSTNGTLSITFGTAVIGNVALGSLNYLVTVLR